jgi:hypothetical protein
MQKRSRVWQAVIFGCGLGVLGMLTLPEIAAASPVRIWSLSPKASIFRDGVSKPARYLMELKPEDLVKPEIGTVLEVICPDKQIRTVQSGVYSGLGIICPLSPVNSIIRSSTLPDRGGHCSSVDPNVLAPAYDRPISTTAAYPTFLFFVPTTSASQAQFVLIGSDRKAIYRQTFVLAGQSGILRVALPTDGSIGELALGQTYKWEFNIICDPDDRGKDDFVVGALQRVPLPNDPQERLPISLRDHLLFYSVKGLNYDELMVLDALRREDPTDGEIQTYWESLLERYKLGDLKRLPAIALKQTP